jgi:DNA polymerase-4
MAKVTVSIGISTNRYLAKIASDRVKPDGLVEINKDNYLEVFSKMKLTDLKGIKKANALRLKRVGINSVIEFYESPIWKLKIAFGGIGGLYWSMHLHGYDLAQPSPRLRRVQKTYGNSYAPPKDKAHLKLEIINKLCQKTGFRLRSAGKGAFGVHLSILFRKDGYWHKSMKTKNVIFEDSDIYKEVLKIMKFCSIGDLPRIISINVFNLVELKNLQLDMFCDQGKKYNLATAIDGINSKFGNYTIYYSKMVKDPTVVQDRISFGQS